MIELIPCLSDEDLKTIEELGEEKEEEFKIHNINNAEERIEYIKNNTNGLNGIDLKDVKQIATGYFNDVYVLLNNGDFYINGVLNDVEINRIYMFDLIRIYKISNRNMIMSVWDLEKWSNLDIYLYNKGCYYKKILANTMYVTALTEEGRVIATHANPTGVGIVPENFIGVDDILELGDLEEPYIVKNNKTIPLYIM